VLDQDAILMTRMAILTNARNAVDRIINLSGARIHDLTDGERRILRYLKDAGVWMNG